MIMLSRVSGGKTHSINLALSLMIADTVQTSYYKLDSY